MQIEVPQYSPATGVPMQWDDEFEVSVANEKGEVVIRANRAGMISLARTLLTLSGEDVPSGTHVHLDQYNTLNDDSAELVIERIDSVPA